MDKQQKWVQLFQTVVGRTPSPKEFLAGKESDFDLKQIKQIAAQFAATSVSDPDVQQDSTVPPQLQTLTPGQQPPQPVFVAAPASVKPAWTPKKKKTVLFGSVAVALLGALATGYYYMDQQTGADVAADQFVTAIQKEDYAGVAEQFSSNDEKWKQADAKEFVAYLEEKINIQTEVDKMVANPEYVYQDDNGNKLLGMEKTGAVLGLFPTYQVVTYPIEIFAKTNQDGLNINQEKLIKDQEMSLGKTRLVSKSFQLSGKNELGEVASEIVAHRSQSIDNQIHLSLNAVEKTIKAKLPEGITGISASKLFINDKEVATALEKKGKVLENQTLVVAAQFSYEGGNYSTEKTTITVSPKEEPIEVALTLSTDTLNKIEAAKKAKAEKEAAAQKEKEVQATIQTFMNDYINAMRTSIRLRQNHFSQYYDTNSEAYRTMEEFVTGGGVAESRIDYQETLEYTVTDIQKEGNDYSVTVHNRFREVYLNGRSDVEDKIQVFKLRPNGSSFLIYAISKY